MEETTKKFGGSKTAIWYGNLLTNIGNWYIGRGNKFITKGTMTTISNPTCYLINPFTLLLTFTVNNTKKYQLITQGDYKDKYKSHGSEENPISNEEMFMIILNKKRDWYLKA